jgi:hypothetical protein
MFGDDFPDAFVHSDGRSCKSMKTIHDLPAEMIATICQSLSNPDIKRLRLTSTDLAEKAVLRIDRVYIAPNRADLDCLNGILDHPVYRSRVREIVWDVGQLIEFPLFEDFDQALFRANKCAVLARVAYAQATSDASPSGSKWMVLDPQRSVINKKQLADYAKEVLGDAGDPTYRAILPHAGDPTHPAILPREIAEESYLLYQKLCQDEREIIRRGWDANGLQRALTELPNIQRITLANGTRRSWHVSATYETPFFRALPETLRRIKSWAWSDKTFDSTEVAGQLPPTYRGYSIMVSSLAANPPPNLQDFVMDPEHYWITGLPSVFLQVTNIDYANTLRVLSGSRIRKFRLSIRAPWRGSHDDALICLQNIISAAPYLENLDLSFIEPSLCDNPPNLFDAGFLHRQCSNLRHITLRSLSANIDWLFELITQTTSLQTCVLNMIDIVGDEDAEHFAEHVLFNHLKNHFAAAAYRGPQFTWITASGYDQFIILTNFCEVLDTHLNAFVYDGSESPFYSVADADPNCTDPRGPKPYKPWARRVEVLETAVWNYQHQYGSVEKVISYGRC